MLEDRCLEVIKSVINSQKDFIVIFNDEEPILTNDAFNSFVGVASFKSYKEGFGPFIDNFVPHPFYFNKEKIADAPTWFDAILKLDSIDRIVSMLNKNHDPHAFSLTIDSNVEDLRIVTFTDITQSLIKRIMIENNTNLDKRSGAYTKQYFLQIRKSYEEASVFNEKIIGLINIEILSANELEIEDIKEFVTSFKKSIRQDDMLVRWSPNSFLLLFLVDDETNASQVVTKVKNSLTQHSILDFTYEFTQTWQLGGEKISKLLEKLSS